MKTYLIKNQLVPSLVGLRGIYVSQYFTEHKRVEVVAELHNLETLTKIDFEKLYLAHCRIEQFHRAIKQVCNIEPFQVRNENPIKNHVFSALKAFVKLEFIRFNQAISHWYELKRNLYLSTIRNFIACSTTLLSTLNA